MLINGNEVSDQLYDLILRCGTNDRSAHSKLYSLLYPKLWMLCLQYSKNKEEAEDLLQDGFIRIFENIHRYQFIGSFHGWARKIIKNRAIQRFRSKKFTSGTVMIENIEVQSQAFEGISSQLGMKELLQMIQGLPLRYKIVFRLFVLEGYSHKEIAAVLRISEGASKCTLFEARSILKRALTISLSVESNLQRA